jgi:hypothetical protein
MGFSLSGLSAPRNLLSPVSPGQFSLVESGNPALQRIGDPLDILGKQAKGTREEAARIAIESTQAGLAQQRRQLEQIEQLQAPFRDVAVETALPTLRTLATGEGEIDFQPSKLAQLKTELGTRGIKRRLAAQGKFGSSQRFEETADLLSQVSAEDLARFEAANLAQLQAGIGSTEALNRAGTTLGAAGGAALRNLGQQLNIGAQQFGAQRQSSFQGAASGLSGLAQLLASRG